MERPSVIVRREGGGEGAGDCEGYVIFLIFQNITMLLTRGERGGCDRDGC